MQELLEVPILQEMHFLLVESSIMNVMFFYGTKILHSFL